MKQRQTEANHRVSPEKPALSPKRFSTALGSSTSLVRKKMRLGEIFYFKVGRMTRIPFSELERLVAEGAVDAHGR
jgi:hypothetical protein